jgi:hypothetical protein
MALEHKYSTTRDINKRQIRSALARLTDEDLSESSPVSAGGEELAVTTGTHDGEDVWVVREEGNDGDWTKTSERAVERAVKTVTGIDQLVATEGGYEPDSDGE